MRLIGILRLWLIVLKCQIQTFELELTLMSIYRFLEI